MIGGDHEKRVAELLEYLSRGFLCDKRDFLKIAGLAVTSLGLGVLNGCSGGGGGTATREILHSHLIKSDQHYLFQYTEDFSDLGGWSIESGFVNTVGSCYLLSRGFPAAVAAPAKTSLDLANAGKYAVFCRSKNWAPEYSPGLFKVAVNGRELPEVLGGYPEERWVWQKAGVVTLEAGRVEVALHDLTGAFGRCSAIMLTTDTEYWPPDQPSEIASLKTQLCGPLPDPVMHPRYDLVVVGGGIAGCLAAIAAARNGSRVALVQDRPVLGGNASNEVGVRPASAADYNPGSREVGLVEELAREAEGLSSNINIGWQTALKNSCDREKNIELFLSTRLTGVRMENASTIAAVTVSEITGGRRHELESFLFADCTGDAELGAAAGATFRMGREANGCYGESWAPAYDDLNMLGNSLLYKVEEITGTEEFARPAWARYFNQESLPNRQVTDLGPFTWIEYAGNYDNLRYAENVRDELLRIVYGLWDYIRNRSPFAGYASRFRMNLKPVMGKRESRRLMGDVVMTQRDLEQTTSFPDVVAFGGWPIDLHALDGIYDSGPPTTVLQRVAPYRIPFRALYSKNIANLMMAGRNISVSHVALGSTRIMGTCGTMGQAVGTAAALASKYGILPRELARDRMAELQTLLQRDDAYLAGLVIKDSEDLAQGAQLSASSEAPGGHHPWNVLSGVSRPTSSGSNAWISDPGQALPQWIRLDFAQPQEVNLVQITFDTNLNIPRPDRQYDPATVSDYEVQLLVGGQWQNVARVKDNYRRLARHHFTRTLTPAVRIMVQKTNGAPSARIFGVRIYDR